MSKPSDLVQGTLDPRACGKCSAPSQRRLALPGVHKPELAGWITAECKLSEQPLRQFYSLTHLGGRQLEGKPATGTGSPERSRMSSSQKRPNRSSDVIVRCLDCKEQTMRLKHFLCTVPLRLPSLLGRQRVEHEPDEDLQDHFRPKMEVNLSRGLSREQAHLANNARRSAGTCAK